MTRAWIVCLSCLIVRMPIARAPLRVNEGVLHLGVAVRVVFAPLMELSVRLVEAVVVHLVPLVVLVPRSAAGPTRRLQEADLLLLLVPKLVRAISFVLVSLLVYVGV